MSANRTKRNEYVRKYRQDTSIRIIHALQSRISPLIKGVYHSCTLAEYLGCSHDYFLQWIQWQLYGPMTMENYGTIWHIDHCNPCDNFNLNLLEDAMSCFNWRNLRPLLQETNLKKHNKVQPRELVLQELKSTVYEKKFPLPDVV
jgi:hypothetical protein